MSTVKWVMVCAIAAISLLPDPAHGARRTQLPFVSDLDEARATARAEGKPLVVSFVAAWCPLCARLRREAFADPGLLSLRENFVWVLVDIDRDPSLARSFGVSAVPDTWLLDPHGAERGRIVGAIEPAALYEVLVDFLRRPPGAEPTRVYRQGARTELTWSPEGYRSRSSCFSHVGYGPLRLPSQSPFQSLRLGLSPRTPSTLATGEWEARAAATWVNIWSNGDEYFLDYEMLRSAASIGYGLSDRLQVDLEIETRSRFGGIMDGFVQGFHDVFGIDQNGRDEVGKGEFTFDLAPGAGKPEILLDEDDRGVFARSAALTFQQNLTCGTTILPAVALAVTARTDTSPTSDLQGGGSLDFGAALALSRRGGPLYLYGTFGHTWFGSERFRGLRLENHQYTLLGALEWRFALRQSLLLQYLYTEGAIEDFGPFSDPSNEITLGWKWEVRDNWILEAGLIENLISFDNSPDFGIHAGISRRF